MVKIFVGGRAPFEGGQVPGRWRSRALSVYVWSGGHVVGETRGRISFGTPSSDAEPDWLVRSPLR